jgi:hypothetical protein
MPILTARDAPISTIRPGAIGALASAEPSEPFVPPRPEEALDATRSLASAVDAVLADIAGTDAGQSGDLSGPLAAAAAEDAPDGPIPPRVLADEPDAIVLVAVREAWVRVRSAEGDTLFEKVLSPGETYEVPAGAAPANLRTGNSGAVYFSVAGRTYGPVAPGVQVVNAELSAERVPQDYALADLEGDTDLARVVAELAAEPVLPGDATRD